MRQELSTTLLHRLKELKNLNRIRIDGARVSDSTFQIIGTNCKFLVEIGLSKCKGVTDKGLVELVSACPNMKILNLTCCDSITDAAVSAIAEYCRSLLSLKVESCNLLTEKSLHLLGSSSLLLKDLDLTDCSGVNDAGKLNVVLFFSCDFWLFKELKVKYAQSRSIRIVRLGHTLVVFFEPTYFLFLSVQ